MSLKTFDDARTALSNIRNINCGGCGIAALAMKRWLKKHMNVESTIIYGFNEASFYQSNKAALDNNDKNLTSSCSHAGIQLKNEPNVMDCDDTWSPTRFWKKVEMPEDFVIESLNKDGVWNHMFNRSYVKTIERNLDIDLSDVPLLDYTY